MHRGAPAAVACRPSELHAWHTCTLILCHSLSADPDEASEHEDTSEEATVSDEEQLDCPEEDSSAAYYSDGDGFPTFLSTGSQVGEEGGPDGEVSLGCERERHWQLGGAGGALECIGQLALRKFMWCCTGQVSRTSRCWRQQ